jgi:hypothetical protein
MNLLPTLLLLCSSWLAAPADELVYQGAWNTTNRKLDGQMTCLLTPLAKEEWRGRFYGIWQGVEFDYTVNFHGPANDLRGVATIDGAAYDWRGRMNERQFKANFGGDRYTGSFDLKRASRAKAASNSRTALGTVAQ